MTAAVLRQCSSVHGYENRSSCLAGRNTSLLNTHHEARLALLCVLVAWAAKAFHEFLALLINVACLDDRLVDAVVLSASLQVQVWYS